MPWLQKLAMGVLLAFFLSYTYHPFGIDRRHVGQGLGFDLLLNAVHRGQVAAQIVVARVYGWGRLRPKGPRSCSQVRKAARPAP